MRRTGAVLLVAIATIAALTGCVGQSPKPSTSPTGTGPTGLGSTAPPAPVDAGEVTAAPEAARDSQQKAFAAAMKVMRTFAQPQLSVDTWLAQMLPLLSQQGGVAYEGTDPSQIPAHQVTGASTVLPGSTEVSLIVQVPTDAGVYNVTLTRPAPSAPWLADRIRPVQG